MFGRKTVISTRFWSVFVASTFAFINAYILILTDNVVVGQFVGDDAVAAMTLIFPIFTLILFVAYLVADGLVMMTSYAQGKGDRAEVDRLFSLGITLSVSCSLVLFVSFFLLREQILDFWEISPNLRFFAGEYYGGLIFYILFQIVSIFNYTIFFSEGMERSCVVASSVSFIVNVILDIVLCQNFGVRGIGLATTCGTLTGVVIQIYYLTGGRSQLHFTWYWSWKKIWRGIVYSFYHSMDTLFISILPMIFSMYVIHYFGDEKLIIVTVAVNLFTLVIAIFTGVIDCLQPMICQYHAENNLHSITKTMRLGMAVTVALGLIMTFAGMILADFLPSMFGVTDSALAEEASEAMRYFLPFITFFGCAMVITHYYIYIGKLNYGAVVKFFLLLIMPLAGMFLSGPLALNILGKYSINIFWLCIGVSFLVTYLMNYFYLKRRNGLLMIDEKNLDRQLSYDVSATSEEVMALTRQIDGELKRRGVADKIRNRIVLCVEEFGMHAVERAERVDKKIFQLEFSIFLEDKVTLVIRDNGKTYDVVKTAQEKKFNFREFFIEGVTAQFVQRKYNFGGDENRMTLQF